MGWFSGLIEITTKILDRMPSRMEALKNTRSSLKKELYALQFQKPFNHVKYSDIANQLQNIEERIANAGG